jgi:peptidoglycan/xylan/chitin deacetylase (PgdA/CDA1 family)
VALDSHHPHHQDDWGSHPRPSPALRVALAGRGALERADQVLAHVVRKDPPGLVVFIFHCVFRDAAEAERGLLDPHERATIDGLRRLLEHFRTAGYQFVSAADIEAGLRPGGHYAHLTFDDGFANNLHLLDLLDNEAAFATVFPSIAHVEQGRAFWWNALYRERCRRGQLDSLPAETALLRRMTDTEVDRYLTAEFGPEAMKPAGDVDRPLTVAELRQLSRSPWIEIGNHTLTHAVLPNYEPAEAATQISGAQEWLGRELGREPFVIAYPNGSLDDQVVATAERKGLRVGMTVEAGLNRLPISAEEKMRLKRFRVVFDKRLPQRLRAVRSSVQLAALARRLAVRGG